MGWEGVGVDEGMKCEASSGDQKKFSRKAAKKKAKKKNNFVPLPLGTFA